MIKPLLCTQLGARPSEGCQEQNPPNQTSSFRRSEPQMGSCCPSSLRGSRWAEASLAIALGHGASLPVMLFSDSLFTLSCVSALLVGSRE